MKATLPTNYQDDILNVSTEGKRKYRMNYNDDGTVSFVDVTPYDQEGSDYGARDINATNQAVNESFDKNKLIRDMDAINALTQEGYAPDALALKDVNNSLQGIANYSTIEKVIGKWIDGVTNVYEKTYYTTTGGVVDGSITSENHTLIGVSGSFYATEYGQELPLPFYYNDTLRCWAYIESAGVNISGHGTIGWYILTIKYIKKS